MLREVDPDMAVRTAKRLMTGPRAVRPPGRRWKRRSGGRIGLNTEAQRHRERLREVRELEE
jgi:hypothetical protein